METGLTRFLRRPLDSRLTPEGFVELVFSMLITALLRGEEDCEPLLAVVRRVLY